MDQTGSPPFASARAAENYLAEALPAATRANPKYLTKSDGSQTEWLTKSVRFSTLPSGAVEVAMDEAYTQSRAGVAAPGTHSATFSLAEVDIAEFSEPGDVTPSGEAARGVLFTCVKPGCVAAVWGGNASRADKTDVYVADEAARARILAAFQYLKGAKSRA